MGTEGTVMETVEMKMEIETMEEITTTDLEMATEVEMADLEMIMAMVELADLEMIIAMEEIVTTDLEMIMAMEEIATTDLEMAMEATMEMMPISWQLIQPNLNMNTQTLVRNDVHDRCFAPIHFRSYTFF